MSLCLACYGSFADFFPSQAESHIICRCSERLRFSAASGRANLPRVRTITFLLFACQINLNALWGGVGFRLVMQTLPHISALHAASVRRVGSLPPAYCKFHLMTETQHSSLPSVWQISTTEILLIPGKQRKRQPPEKRLPFVTLANKFTELGWCLQRLH